MLSCIVGKDVSTSIDMTLAPHAIDSPIGMSAQLLTSGPLCKRARLGLLGIVTAMAQETHRQGLGDFGPKTVNGRHVLKDVSFSILPAVFLGRLTDHEATLHESGMAIFSAAYGRNFAEENDLLPELDLKRLSAPELQQLARVGFQSC